MSESYFYDGNGNLTKKTDGNSSNIEYEHDKLNRLTKRIFVGTGTDVRLVYDAAGRRTQMTDSTGANSYEYDDVARLTKVTYPIGAGKTVESLYDLVGNRTKMKDPDGGETVYDIDPANRLTKLTYNPTTDNQITIYDYDKRNLVTKQTHRVGASDRTYSTCIFDGTARLTKLENRKSDNSLLSSFDYTVDPVGNRSQIVESVLFPAPYGTKNGTITFGYDKSYRLTSEARSGDFAYSYTYEYDAAGNRTKYAQTSGSTEYFYDAANRLTRGGNITYSWDSNGNLTKKQVDGGAFTELWYDGENHMTKLNDGTTLELKYDGNGARQEKKVISGSTTITKFVYDRKTGTPGRRFHDKRSK